VGLERRGTGREDGEVVRSFSLRSFGKVELLGAFGYASRARRLIVGL
jgi:hypothetical protein